MHLPNSAAWWPAFLFYVVATVAAALTVRYRSPQQRALWATIFVAVVAGFANVVYASAASVGYLAAGIASACIAGWALYDRRFESSRWMARAGAGAIVLRPPFTGRWRVLAGGPVPKHNHHSGVSEQYFAYDFVAEDGQSWNAAIVSPCRGMVLHVEDRQDDAPPAQRRRDRANPLGNYVSIETSRGYVILAHLQRGSIVVRVGDPVSPGHAIGRCGNSGNTCGAHLHVHAQDRPRPEGAQAVPIGFIPTGSAEPLLLEYGDTLE